MEFLQSGRSIPHVMAMLVPEAWSGNPDMDEDKRAFYEYHASLMEPWDGPAALCFTDGKIIGATLDRNGLRPGRYIVTKDDLVVLASEAGVLDVPAKDIRKKGRLQPGKCSWWIRWQGASSPTMRSRSSWLDGSLMARG